MNSDKAQIIRDRVYSFLMKYGFRHKFANFAWKVWQKIRSPESRIRPHGDYSKEGSLGVRNVMRHLSRGQD